MKRFPYTPLAAALIVGLFSSYASAAGFQLLEENASGLATAYAGAGSVADNASTIFFNPAGMTQLKERELSVGVAAIGPSFKFTNGSSATGSFSTAGNGGDAGSWTAVPNAYLSWALQPDLYFGVGLCAPFGLKTEYSTPWIGSAQANSFSIETMNLNPSVAYRVNDQVSVGGGISYQHIDAEYKRFAAVNDAGGAQFTKTSVTAKLKGDAWGWNLGAIFAVSPDTRVGLSYRSTMDYNTTGDITATGPTPALNAGGTSGATASLKLPDTAILSLTHRLDNRWQLLSDLAWTGWSSIPKLDLVRTTTGQPAQTLITDFQDTWRVAVGANYQYQPDLVLKFGVAYDQTPVKGASTRLVSLPDADRTQVSAGAQWKLNGGATFDLGLAYLVFADAPINNNQTSANPQINRGTVNGSYAGSVVIVGVQYSVPF